MYKRSNSQNHFYDKKAQNKTNTNANDSFARSTFHKTNNTINSMNNSVLKQKAPIGNFF